MVETQFIKDKLAELITSGYEVNRISYGKKTVSGSITDEDSFIFGVTQKKPIESLSEDEILPTYVTSGSVEIKTDVVEVAPVSTIETLDFLTPILNTSYESVTVAVSVETISGSSYVRITAPEDQLFSTDQIQRILDVVGNGGVSPTLGIGESAEVTVEIMSEDCPTCPETPASAHRVWSRPMKPGTQVASSDTSGAGTLGFFAVDNDTGALVGVTNNHVTTGTAIKVSQQKPYYAQQIATSGEVGQPVWYTNGGIQGPVVRFNLLDISAANTVDCSLFTVKESAIDVNESYKQFGLSWSGSLEFASTAEIDSIVPGVTELYSSGRTTGVKEGVCGLRATSTSVALTVSGYIDRPNWVRRTISFTDCIEFTRIDPTCPYPINSGDSGSSLIANFGGTWKIVGLCFAGSTYTGYACRIDNVVSEMNISAWNGAATAFIDPDSIKTYTLDGLQSATTHNVGGETYYAFGSTLNLGSQN